MGGKWIRVAYGGGDAEGESMLQHPESSFILTIVKGEGKKVIKSGGYHFTCISIKVKLFVSVRKLTLL